MFSYELVRTLLFHVSSFGRSFIHSFAISDRQIIILLTNQLSRPSTHHISNPPFPDLTSFKPQFILLPSVRLFHFVLANMRLNAAISAATVGLAEFAQVLDAGVDNGDGAALAAVVAGFVL